MPNCEFRSLSAEESKPGACLLNTSTNTASERLDRAVANQGWCCTFPNAKIIHGDPGHSDHRPIMVHINSEELRLPMSHNTAANNLGLMLIGWKRLIVLKWSKGPGIRLLCWSQTLCMNCKVMWQMN